MKEMINKSKIEGLLYESTIEEKQTGEKAQNPGANYLTGKIFIQVAEDNIVPIEILEFEITKKGKKNKKYDDFKRLITSPSVLKDGPNSAIGVKIDSAINLNEWHDEQGELISNPRNFNGFMTILSPNQISPKSNFELDILITSVADDMEKNEDGQMEPNDNLVVNGYIFDFAKRIMPIRLLVESPGGVQYFKGLEPNTFTKVWGDIYTQSNKVQKVEESAFGEDKVVEYTKTRKKYVITGTNKEPYGFDVEGILTKDEVKEAIAQRNIYLADAKTKTEEYRKSKGAAGPAKETIAAASSSDDDFDF